ncbi:hypothetical protein [Bacteroides congonensis]
MMYNARTNREINPAVMPAGWVDKGKYGMFSIYPGSTEKAGFMAKFPAYNDKANVKEILCFLLSNYVAYERGLKCDQSAMEVLKCGKQYNAKYREAGLHYTIGSIPRPFYSMLQNSLQCLPIKKMSHLAYYALTAFYYAPDRIVSRMCDRISKLKHPEEPKAANRYVILQAMIPEATSKRIHAYASSTGMSVNELMCTVLSPVCMSKKERMEDNRPISRVFSLYRIMRQKNTPFDGDNLVSLYVFVGNGHDKKYLRKFLDRRNIAKSEILRMAVRTLEYVILNSWKLAKKVQYVQDEPEEEADEMNYVYSRMERMDFYRSIYK